jgi:hypothetical protein
MKRDIPVPPLLASSRKNTLRYCTIHIPTTITIVLVGRKSTSDWSAARRAWRDLYHKGSRKFRNRPLLLSSRPERHRFNHRPKDGLMRMENHCRRCRQRRRFVRCCYLDDRVVGNFLILNTFFVKLAALRKFSSLARLKARAKSAATQKSCTTETELIVPSTILQLLLLM